MIPNETMILLRKHHLHEHAALLSIELHYGESGFAVHFEFLAVHFPCL